MALTVTTTAAGPGVFNGICLGVVVLTGATETGGASFGNQGSTGAGQGSVTPNFSSSLIYWAYADGTGATTPTAATSNTLSGTGIGNDNDATNGFDGAAGAYTGTVTSGTPVTAGCSAPTGHLWAFAAYEIPQAGSIAVDASTPAFKTSATKTVTSNSFTPPAGAVLVALTAADGGGSGTNTMSISDTSGLTWTRRAISATSGTTNSLAVVYTATVPAAGAPVPVQPSRPGRTWLRQFRHRQLVTPGPFTTAYGATAGLATGTGAAQGAAPPAPSGGNFVPGRAIPGQEVPGRPYVAGLTVQSAAQSQPPVPPAAPGRTWLRMFKHRQLVTPPGPSAVAGSATAGLATGTGAALQPSVAVTATAGLAAATGAAQPPVPAAGANAQLATGTGAALAPTAGDGGTAALATGTGAAQQPSIAITVGAGLATGTGTALSPSVSTSGSTNANAGLATGTGAAQQPVAAIGATAGLASGAGAAPAPGHGAGIGLATGTAAAQPDVLAAAALAQAAAALAAALAPTAVPVQPFTIGALTASDAPRAVLSATDAGSGSGAVLKTSDTRLGGPG